KKIDTIQLDIYPMNNSDFLLYDDDGESLEYLNGNYAETLIEVDDNDLRTEIKVNAPKGSYNMDGRSFSFKVHLQDQPKEIYVNNKKIAPKDRNTNGKPIPTDQNNPLLFTVSPKNKEFTVILKK